MQAAWNAVHLEAKRLKTIELKTLFEADPNRFETLSCSLDDLLIDYSKEKIDLQAMKVLIALAKESNLVEKQQDMFAGKSINKTENRPDRKSVV